MPNLSIVVPVYKEEKTIEVFLNAMEKVLANVTDNYEIIFAMDPSPDRTEEIILEANKNDKRIKLLKFSRRFGQPAATWGGLAYSKGKAVIVIDCDLQDPPELIEKMYKIWQQGQYKVILPQRRSRKGENIIKKAIAYTGYWFINKTASVEIPRNTGDFRLMDRRVVDELMTLNESHGFLRGLTAVVGFKTKILPFDRLARVDGEGKYNSFTGSITIGFNGIVAFSGVLLRMTGIAGFIMAMLAVAAAIIIPIVKITGLWDFATGMVTLGVMLLFFTGCQLLALGILGAYIGRIYEETKQRPKFIVEEAIGFDE